MRYTHEKRRYEEQRELIDRLMEPQPIVVAIEGGPCSGKTTLVNRLVKEARNGGRPIAVLPEAATRHITKLSERGIDIGWLASHDREGFLAFERDVLRTILDDIATAKEAFAGTDTILVADRMDIGAYISQYEYGQILASLGESAPPIIAHADKVVYLPSVAREAPHLYEGLKSTNPARYESLVEAQDTCEANLWAVARHPELSVLWGGFDSFEDKMAAAAEAVLHPESEKEVKFRAKPGSHNAVELMLASSDILASSFIDQSYHQIDGMTYRLRVTTTDRDEVIHSFTIKTGEGIERTELQRQISRQEYETLRASPQIGGTLTKERYTMLRNDSGKKDETSHGQKRLWVADKYFDRRLEEWFLEAEVASVEEAEGVIGSVREWGIETAHVNAEKLARFIGHQALAA